LESFAVRLVQRSPEGSVSEPKNSDALGSTITHSMWLFGWHEKQKSTGCVQEMRQRQKGGVGDNPNILHSLTLNTLASSRTQNLRSFRS
jgi:hypothetical protein